MMEKFTSDFCSTGILLCLLIFMPAGHLLTAQSSDNEVVISGARFSNPIFESWIKGYCQIHPETKFRIEDKGAAEFSSADLIVHGYRSDKAERDQNREYITIARYAILIVSNEKSPFSAYYGRKGINRTQITQIFFFDPVENGDKPDLRMPFQVYTRVQLAPSPMVFAACFGYDQQHIHGRAIAGSDLHLLNSVLRDSLGITFLPLPLVYSPETGSIVRGIRVIPVDFDGNDRISDDEIFYDNSSSVLERLRTGNSENIPVAEIQVSISRKNANPDAVQFLTWILNEGNKSLPGFGYLDPDPRSREKDLAGLAKLEREQP